MNIEIANRLVRLRKENHLSQEELAARIGVSRQAVSKWERAEASPDTDNLILLARLYGLSLDELLQYRRRPAGTAASGRNRAASAAGESAGPLPEQELLAAVSLSGAGGDRLPADGFHRPLVAPGLACILLHSVVLCVYRGNRPGLGRCFSRIDRADLSAAGLFRPLVASRLADFLADSLILSLERQTIKDG